MNKLNNSNILVTGGAGFIGSHLVDGLIEKDYRVTIIDNLRNGSLSNLKNALKSKNVTFIKGDILKKSDLKKAMKNIDIIFHLACLGVRHSLHSPFENHRVNAEGTLLILEAAKKYKVKKVFYISSSEIYGGVLNFPIRETDCPKPLTVYGASKLVGENYTNAYNKCFGLDTTIIRLFNNYGPRAHFEGDAGELIPRTIMNAFFNKSPIIFGDGSYTRDFLYVKDTVRALLCLMNFNNLEGKTFNVGTGKEIKITDVIAAILFLMNKNKLKINHIKSRPADVPRLWVDANKFYNLTNFKCEYSFSEGLKKTIEYYLPFSKSKRILNKIIEKNWLK